MMIDCTKGVANLPFSFNRMPGSLIVCMQQHVAEKGEIVIGTIILLC